MERKNLALLCAGVVCFWLFALAFGTAQGSGLRRQSPAVQTAVQPQGAGGCIFPGALYSSRARSGKGVRRYGELSQDLL